MRRLLALLLIVIAASPDVRGTSPADSDVSVFAYHDVVDDTRSLAPDSITTRNLAMHFDWLRTNGYTVVSLDEIFAAHRGERPLPPRPVLLTFDDGYRSMYTRVFPLLLAFGYPAVFAVVGSWLEPPPLAQLRIGDRTVPRETFVSWTQIREMQQSGLVEVASHSYALHTTVLANPSGSEVPAGVTRQFVRSRALSPRAARFFEPLRRPRFGDIRQLLDEPYREYLELVANVASTPIDPAYDAATGRYETETAYRGRVRTDFEQNSRLLEAKLGVRPRVMAWPHGRYNEITLEEAHRTGMPVTLTLDQERGNVRDLARLSRFFAGDDPSLNFLTWSLLEPPRAGLVRGLCLTLDEVFASSAREQEARLGSVLNLVAALRPSAILLSAAAAPGSGAAGSVYFPNEQLPVRADLFSRVAWQLRTRAGVDVYAWLPIDTPVGNAAAMTLYQDLARAIPFSGIGLGLNFLAGQLQPVKLPDGVSPWDSRIPRRLRAEQDRAHVSESARLGLAAIENVVRYQPDVRVLDGVELAQLRPPADIAVDAVDNLAVRWSGSAKAAIRTLDSLGWLQSPMVNRLVFVSAQEDPDEWNELQEAGVLNGIYCPDSLLNRARELEDLRAVLGAARFPFRP